MHKRASRVAMPISDKIDSKTKQKLLETKIFYNKIIYSLGRYNNYKHIPT